jgi:hypothetical protein
MVYRTVIATESTNRPLRNITYAVPADGPALKVTTEEPPDVILTLGSILPAVTEKVIGVPSTTGAPPTVTKAVTLVDPPTATVSGIARAVPSTTGAEPAPGFGAVVLSLHPTASATRSNAIKDSPRLEELSFRFILFLPFISATRSQEHMP